MTITSRPFEFHEPSVIIENISRKVVDIVGIYRLQPGQKVDIYNVINPKVTGIEERLLRGIIKPYGDLYIEQEIKKTIRIHKFILAEFYYTIASQDSNFDTVNASFPGAVPSVNADGRLEWISSSGGGGLTAASSPLVLNGTIVSIQQADGYTDGYLTQEDWTRFDRITNPATGSADGYLTKEDWVRFNAASNLSKPNIVIWQYQDFTAPVGSSVTLSAFENGTGLVFNSSYIVNSTADIVLASDSSKPPTTTTSIPGKYLPGNRVTVASHISTAVLLNQAPAASLTCRVFFQIDLPTNVQLPSDYQEDPEFSNKNVLEFIDDNYVNQNQDESIFGEKTFEEDSRFNGNVGIGQAPTTPLDVLGKTRTTEFQLTTDPTDGYFLKSDLSGNASWEEISADSLLTVTSPLVLSNGTLSMPPASPTQDGYLSKDDFGIITGSFANRSLSNLVTTNVNTSLIPATDDGYDLGSLSRRWQDGYFSGLLQSAAFKMATGALDGYVLKTNVSGFASWSQISSTSATNPLSPNTGDLYFNTTLQTLMEFDGSRGKWFSVESEILKAGRAGGTAAGAFYRGIDSVVMSATIGFTAPYDGTIIGIGYTRSDSDSATFEVTAGGITIASLASSATSGRDVSATINGDFSAGNILAIRNATGSNGTSDVQVWARMKWRA